MKTIYFIIVSLLFTLNIRGQETEEISYEKGETETYEIIESDDSKFIFRKGIPFNSKAPSPDVAAKKYKIWPKRTLVDEKEYVKKFILPYINGEITTKNSYLSMRLYYELSSGNLKWIAIYHDNSITIPIKSIERFEKAMMKDDKAIFNRSTEGITDIDFFQVWTDYDLNELKYQTDESSD